MLHRLADRWGIPDVMELDRTMSDNQLTYWAAFFRVWPSGEDAMDARFAVLRSDIWSAVENILYTIGRVSGNKPTRPKGKAPSKLLPLRRGANSKPEPQTQQDLSDQMYQIKDGFMASWRRKPSTH